MRESFILYTQINEILKEMTDEQKGQLFQAIVDYEITDEVPELPTLVKIAFIPIKQGLDANNKKYDDIRQARSDAGKRSAERRTQQKRTNPNKEEQTQTSGNKQQVQTANGNNGEHYVNVNDNALKEKTPPKGGVKEKGEDPLSESGISEPLQDKVREWLQYKKERRESYRPTGMRSLITQVAKAEQSHGTLAVMEQIETAMSSGWKGMGLDRMRASPGLTVREPTGAELAMQMAMEARGEAPWEPPWEPPCRDLDAEVEEVPGQTHRGAV